MMARADLVVVLARRHAAQRGAPPGAARVPVLGVNLGGLALTDVRPTRLLASRLLAGRIERRCMLTLRW
jgi:hypothetical protein